MMRFSIQPIAARAIALGLLLLPLTGLNAQNYREGVHYDVIDSVQSVPSGDTVEVVEVFSYVCPHCFSFQPHVKAWEEEQPAHTKYVRMPALLGRRSWVPYARAYYTAEVMGVLDQTHDPLFRSLHVERVPLRSDADIADFFEDQGVSKDDYLRTAESFAVVTKLQRAQKMEREFGIRGTPTLIVGGKYRISSNANIQPHQMFDVVNFLVAKELASAASESGDDGSSTGQQGSD